MIVECPNCKSTFKVAKNIDKKKFLVTLNAVFVVTYGKSKLKMKAPQFRNR